MVQGTFFNMDLDDHPAKTLNLIKDINTNSQKIAVLLDNLIYKVKNNELNTDQGLSFLEIKYNMLLSYLINLNFVVLRKCSGETISQEPCINRLVEIRTILEKIRPIDHKLKYQIDKLVKTALSGVSGDDPALFKANINNLMDDSDSDGSDDGDPKSSVKEKKKTGLYVPPKLSAVPFEDDNAIKKNKNIREKLKKNAISSSIMQDLKEEYLDTPIEVSQTNRAQQILSKQMKERQEYEEEYMTRLPRTKEDKQRRKHLTTLGRLGAEITDFGDLTSKSSKKRKHTGKTKKKSFKKKRLH